jgi:hypothetical protein
VRRQQNLERYLRLQNGSDIRGVALEGCAFEAGRIGECASEDEPMTLSVAVRFPRFSRAQRVSTVRRSERSDGVRCAG